jgi:hypothetical protein
MDKNSLVYKLCRGYAIGFCLTGAYLILPAVGMWAQLGLGLSTGLLGYTWWKDRQHG